MEIIDSDNRRTRSCQEAAGRLFRAYEHYCKNTNEDTLFNLLNATHSLNDRLGKAIGRDLHQFEGFVALKSLRNLAHHEEDVRANFRFIFEPTISDLASICILRRDQVERAIQGVHTKYREATRSACEAQFHWYGQAVNINPCLFNLVVHIFELLREVEVEPPEESVALLRESYEYELENGFSHFVSGRFTAPAGDLELLLQEIAAQMPEP